MILASSTFVAVVLLTVMILIFVGSFYLNRKTKIPEGCKEQHKECAGCSITFCPSHKAMQEDPKKEVVKTIDMDREVQEYLDENKK